MLYFDQLLQNLSLYYSILCTIQSHLHILEHLELRFLLIKTIKQFLSRLFVKMFVHFQRSIMFLHVI